MTSAQKVPPWVFPAVRGVQAKGLYYVAMVPLRQVAKLLGPVDPQTAPQNRAQRAMNKTRVPKIVHYILSNPESYTFSALTGAIDGDPTFTPAAKGARFGTLTIPQRMRVTVLDGQHRRAAIETAVAADNAKKKGAVGLADESIAVVLFIDTGLARAQQRFADLNRFGVRVNGSLGILYDHRDEHARLAKAVVDGVPVFAGLTEGERASCAGRSAKLFSLAGIHAATRELLTRSDLGPKAAEQTAVAFWRAVAAALKPWQAAAEGKAAAPDLRREYVHAHTVGLQAIGRVGYSILRLDPKQQAAKIGELANIDWSRKNTAIWEGRAMVGGQMSKATANVVLTANAIKTALGFELSPDERTFEGALGRR